MPNNTIVLLNNIQLPKRLYANSNSYLDLSFYSHNISATDPFGSLLVLYFSEFQTKLFIQSMKVDHYCL